MNYTPLVVLVLIACLAQVAVAIQMSYVMDSTADFDTGNKGESDGNYLVETRTDNPAIADGYFELASLKGDAFNIYDADADTWKWNRYTNMSNVLSLNNASITGAFFRNEIIMPNNEVNWQYGGIATPSAALTGDFDVRVKLSQYCSMANCQYKFVIGEQPGQPSGEGAAIIYSSSLRQSYRIVGGIWAVVGTSPSDYSVNMWFRLVRSSQVVEGYYSADGSTWNSLGTYDFGGNLSSSLYASMYLAFHVDISAGTPYYDDPFATISMASASLSSPGGNTSMRGEWDNYTVYSGALASDSYRTSGNWSSPVNSMPAGYRLKNTVITYSGVDLNNYIDRIEWKVGGVVKAAYDTNIVSGTNLTITSANLTSGSFSAVNESFTFAVYLVGNGSATPSVDAVYGDYVQNATVSVTQNATIYIDSVPITNVEAGTYDVSITYSGVPLSLNFTDAVLDHNVVDPLAVVTVTPVISPSGVVVYKLTPAAGFTYTSVRVTITTSSGDVVFDVPYGDPIFPIITPPALPDAGSIVSAPESPLMIAAVFALALAFGFIIGKRRVKK